MKTLVTCVVLFLFTATAATCQDDDTIQYIHGLPVTGEDQLQPKPPEDFSTADSLVEISAEQLPKELVKTLADGPQFRGWENHVIELDKNTGLYWLHLRNETGILSYGFAPNGHPVSVQERTLPKE